MKIVHSFIGDFPVYAVDSIEQTRKWFHGPIYFILSDTAHPLVAEMVRRFAVTVIPYDTVKAHDFTAIAQQMDHKFIKCPDLTGREQLFMRAYERYFLLYRLMIQYGLTNVLFMEVDNLLYSDPTDWLPVMSLYSLAYMYDNESRCGAGIAYVRDAQAVLQLNLWFVRDLQSTDPSQGLVHEMRSLHDYAMACPDRVLLLPTAPPQPMYPQWIHQNTVLFPGTLFDVAGMGIYLGGLDPIHTGGQIEKGRRAPWSAVDYTVYRFEWRTDPQGRRIPYLLSPTGEWLRIHNLHIHSKALRECMS